MSNEYNLPDGTILVDTTTGLPAEKQLSPMPDDPAKTIYPEGLALELVLEVATPAEILDSYGLTNETFIRIAKNPTFIKEYKLLKQQAKQEGWSFKMRAQAQAEGLLATSWRLIHDKATPAAVKADLIKHTTKVAGYEPSTKEDLRPKENIVVNINLGDGQKPIIIDGSAQSTATQLGA